MMRRVRQWIQVSALYAVLTIPFGIALHLAAEAIALGSSLDQPTFFARHLYLFLIEMGAGLLLWTCSGTRSLGVVRAELCSMLRLLPGLCHTGRYFMANVALQWCFFLVTIRLESTALSKDEMFVGCGVALLGACFSSVALALLPQKLLAVLCEFYFRQLHSHAHCRCDVEVAPWLCSAMRFLSGFQTVTGSRPPPSILLRSDSLLAVF